MTKTIVAEKTVCKPFPAIYGIGLRPLSYIKDSTWQCTESPAQPRIAAVKVRLCE